MTQNYETIQPGVTYAQTVKNQKNETLYTDNNATSETQNKTTYEILEKMLTMMQVTQQQMLDQMQQLLTFIKTNG